MKRILAVLGAASLVISIATLSGGGGAQANTPARAAAALTWTSCGDLQCATLAVPMDYANPSKGTVTLALTRKVHTRTPYRGIMLTNPGGPGASGTGLPVLSDFVPNGAGAYYDWIGFDPRGVGQSTPSLHCNRHYFGVNRPNYTPFTSRLMKYWVAKTTAYSQACGRSTARALLPYLTTRDTVRDMESIRAAYQAGFNPLDTVSRTALDKLNFYGFSYGTYLGQVYAVTYPQKVGRFVLDGVVDPISYWYRANLNQEIGFDRNIKIYFRWLAAHPRAFGLGRDAGAILRGFRAELRKLDRHPAAAGRLGPDELIDAMLSAGYYVYDWTGIGHAYADLIKHGRGGALFQMYAAANMGDDNGFAMYLATQCTDVLRPPWSRQVRDAWQINATHPFLAWDNTWFNAPCRHWPAPSHARIPIYGGRAGVRAPILMINETYDAATPFSGALTSRGRFPTSALIEGVGGTTHAGSLSGVACVDNRIARYLATGTIPARLSGRRSDVRCPRVPPPPASAARLSAGGLPAWLRAELMAAQGDFLGG